MNELWRVQLGTGEVRMMTIDDLDRAFDAGYIHSRTNVLAPGSMRWTTLGDAAGLDDASYVEQTPSLSPMAIAGASSYSLPSMAPAAMPSMASYLDDEDPYTKKRGKGGIVAGFIVAAAAAACAFAVTTGRVPSQLKALLHQTNVEATAVATQPATETKLPEPAAKAVTEAPKLTEAKAAINDDTKQRLLDQDKARTEKLKVKGKKGRRLRVQQQDGDQPAPEPKADKWVQGGDKYDPLNGSL
jgi:hypothetical protein